MTDLRVEGLDSLRKIARDFRAIDDRKLIRKEFNAGLRKDLAGAMQPHTSQAALSRLPKRGKLNERVAKAPVTVKTNTSSEKYAGVDLVAGRKGSGAGGADRGEVRHPLFGDWGRPAVTRVRPGWFTDTVKHNMDLAVPIVDKHIQGLLDRVGSGRV